MNRAEPADGRHDRSTQTPILMYHAVSEDASPRFATYAVTPNELDAQLDLLVDLGLTFLTVDAYARIVRDGGPLPAGAVVLTFDDGFRDFLDHALPSLDRHRAQATLYVTTGYVGETSRWLADEGEGDRRMLDWDELAHVASMGIEIGAHSHRHPQLDRLSPPAVEEEVRTSRELLRSRLAVPVTTFAYPFGYHTAQVREAVRRAGFLAACEVRHLMSRRSDDPYALRRMLVPRGLGLDAFRALVTTPDRPLDRVVREIREAGSRTLRVLSAARPRSG